MKTSLNFFLCLGLLGTARLCWGRLGTHVCKSDDEWELHPQLCQLAQDMSDPTQSHDQLDVTHRLLAQELFDFAIENGWIIDFRDSSFVDDSMLASSGRALLTSGVAPATVPIVLAHGMGDSCFNGGMQHVTKLMTEWMGVYAVCVPTKPTTRTMDSFLVGRSKNPVNLIGECQDLIIYFRFLVVEHE
jgi:hypothetical protein